MPSVRKTTHFTDGALFSFLSHPLFLLPLPIPSTGSVSRSASRFRLPFRFPSATQFFWHKSVYREHAPHHYTQNDAATQGISCKRMYREQKNRHYRQNSAATQIFRLKRVCRGQCGFKTVYRVRRRWTSRDRLVSKNHLAVSRRKIKGAGEEVGEIGGHEDVHGYVSVAGGRNDR